MPSDRTGIFCDEPWVGIFSIRTNGDVICCPCYAQVRLGNLAEASLHDLWNGETMRGMRSRFAEGKLPRQCRGQLCPPVLEAERNGNGGRE